MEPIYRFYIPFESERGKHILEMAGRNPPVRQCEARLAR